MEKVIKPGNQTSVTSVTVGGALATVIVWGAVSAGYLPPPPAEVMGAIVTIAIAGVGLLFR